MTGVTLPSAAPASYAALYGFIAALAAEQDPPIFVVQGDLQEFEPATYIVIEGVFDDQFVIEATGYTYIEHFSIEGNVTIFTGSGPTDSPGNIPATVMAATYTAYANVVMAAAVTNRGGNGIPVLGVESYPWPFEIKAHLGNYSHSPGFIDGVPSGWQGTLNWSVQLRALVSPYPV
jgi:hypothetical protein